MMMRWWSGWWWPNITMALQRPDTSSLSPSSLQKWQVAPLCNGKYKVINVGTRDIDFLFVILLDWLYMPLLYWRWSMSALATPWAPDPGLTTLRTNFCSLLMDSGLGTWRERVWGSTPRSDTSRTRPRRGRDSNGTLFKCESFCGNISFNKILSNWLEMFIWRTSEQT